MSEAKPRIYLDNAATSFPKPESVYAAVDRYQRDLGTAVGRGASTAANEVQRVVDQCRLRASKILGVASSSHVIFCQNGTEALNLALHGLLRNGDHVVATCWEHNSVLRPLAELQRTRNLTATFVSGNEEGIVSLADVRDAITKETALICLTHASNVTGVIQPVEEVVKLARENGVLVLLDAAQTAGHLPLSMTELDVDLLACPGHKGLLGPLGTGILAMRTGLEERIQSLRQGGTGTISESEFQPDSLPEKYESGNHNALGLFGLEAALKFLEETGEEVIAQHELALIEQFTEGLKQLPNVRVFCADGHSRRVGVVSLTMAGVEPQVLSSLLDEHFQIETRAGLHCAPRAHQCLGTLDTGGTIRFSVGPMTTAEEIDLTLESLAQISAAL